MRGMRGARTERLRDKAHLEIHFVPAVSESCFCHLHHLLEGEFTFGKVVTITRPTLINAVIPKAERRPTLNVMKQGLTFDFGPRATLKAVGWIWAPWLKSSINRNPFPGVVAKWKPVDVTLIDGPSVLIEKVVARLSPRTKVEHSWRFSHLYPPGMYIIPHCLS
jgi:hypothetical protein